VNLTKLSKQNLIDLINRALRIEEESVPHLASHVISAMDFLEKDDVLREKIIAVMNILKSESTEHAELLNTILKELDKIKEEK
jgi:hypothetical protein